MECAEILKLLCVALLNNLHLSLECAALGVAITLIHGRKIANGATKCPSMWTENNIHARPLGLPFPKIGRVIIMGQDGADKIAVGDAAPSCGI